MNEFLRYVNLLPVLTFIQQFVAMFGIIIATILAGMRIYDGAACVAIAVIIATTCVTFYKQIDNKISTEL